MHAHSTAIVLIEYQNDFTTPGGVFHDAVKDVMHASNMLANTAATIEQARKLGVTIIHMPIQFADSYPELTLRSYGILKGVVDAGAFRAGSWGAQITDALSREPGDILVEGKRGLDAFASTGLDLVLRNNGIQNLVVAGFLTNCCVEGTVRSGYEKGYDVVTLTDCTATFSAEQQHAAESYTLPMFSQPLQHTAFLAGLKAQ
ncbi:cysteine hydrolase [Pseudomonas sp. BCA14]|uniref:cysteine hydrolase n=1 Tax=unclassified Pseudomonas TaxID=196821 RepID=UPI00106EAD52|nr:MULTISPECIES: cysteine hydrolase [unclassified Pseudomonas]TFF14324.1 cysteine hydrolase [Pseudomonas sp. JMN1]TFF14992.1 cysteine hydrolase [Pseudomonas sp. BCA17]TFF31398.1 cysteine hydrolase [Pseudomonas sp. BCA14]TFF32352.1 cysteine hydrolase [Pseudomonas sp. BCA13]